MRPSINCPSSRSSALAAWRLPTVVIIASKDATSRTLAYIGVCLMRLDLHNKYLWEGVRARRLIGARDAPRVAGAESVLTGQSARLNNLPALIDGLPILLLAQDDLARSQPDP